MNKFSIKELSVASSTDVKEVIKLFNSNNVYKISKNIELSENDFKLTYNKKEIKKFYLLYSNNRLIGTTALFNYVIFPNNMDIIYSGYLLIDKEFRSGKAISFLQQKIAKLASKEHFGIQLTEINKWNKPSLSLSKINHFSSYPNQYEDLNNCVSLINYSTLFLSMFKACGDITNFFDIYEFKITNIVDRVKTIRAYFIVGEFIGYIDLLSEKNEIIKLKIKRLLIVDIKEDYYLLDYNASFFERATSIINNKKMNIQPKKKNFFEQMGHIQVNFESKKGTLSFDLFKKQQEEQHIENCIQVFLKNTFFEMCIDNVTGDILFFKDERLVMTDIFAHSKELKNTVKNIKVAKDKIILWVENDDIKIVKTVQIKNNSLNFKVIVDKGKEKLKNMKFGCQFNIPDYEIKNDEDLFLPMIEGEYPCESDDFLYYNQFKKGGQYYYLYNLGIKVKFFSDEFSGNQMRFRPLLIPEKSEFCYSLKFYDEVMNKLEFKNARNIYSIVTKVECFEAKEIFPFIIGKKYITTIKNNIEIDFVKSNSRYNIYEMTIKESKIFLWKNQWIKLNNSVSKKQFLETLYLKLEDGNVLCLDKRNAIINVWKKNNKVIIQLCV